MHHLSKVLLLNFAVWFNSCKVLAGSIKTADELLKAVEHNLIWKYIRASKSIQNTSKHPFNVLWRVGSTLIAGDRVKIKNFDLFQYRVGVDVLPIAYEVLVAALKNLLGHFSKLEHCLNR